MNHGRLGLYSFILIFFMITALPAKAELSYRIGSGMSTTTSGRRIPLAYGGIESKDYALSLSSVGYKNTLGYMSAWNLNAYALFYPDKFWWGKMQAGLGLGVFYYQEGFKNGLDDGGMTKKNYTAGPSIRVLWSIAGPIYLGLEAVYGIRPRFLSNHLLLSTQDTVQLLAGVEF